MVNAHKYIYNHMLGTCVSALWRKRTSQYKIMGQILWEQSPRNSNKKINVYTLQVTKISTMKC